MIRHIRLFFIDLYNSIFLPNYDTFSFLPFKSYHQSNSKIWFPFDTLMHPLEGCPGA